MCSLKAANIYMDDPLEPPKNLHNQEAKQYFLLPKD